MTTSDSSPSTGVELFYDDIDRHAKAINDDAYDGNERALRVLRAYHLHRNRPNDPAALGVCKAAYWDWANHRASRIPPEEQQ